MPGGDRTGPMGRGPVTGWGRGYCGGSTEPGAVGGGFGGWRGGGAGGAWGRGWRHRNWAQVPPGRMGGGPWAGPGRWWPGEAEPSAEDELRLLEREAAALETELKRIRTRLEELEPAAPEQE